ncbi:MAG: hypothetical protein E6Q43_03235 [Dokdonella sp.]|nr:MAG: hypothetical protein E6Q43_03235 [Dokdonella sp.]
MSLSCGQSVGKLTASGVDKLAVSDPQASLVDGFYGAMYGTRTRDSWSHNPSVETFFDVERVAQKAAKTQ